MKSTAGSPSTTEQTKPLNDTASTARHSYLSSAFLVKPSPLKHTESPATVGCDDAATTGSTAQKETWLAELKPLLYSAGIRWLQPGDVSAELEGIQVLVAEIARDVTLWALDG